MSIDKRKGLQTALAYVQQGKLDQAIAEYQTILEAEPNNCNVLNALGDLSARVGNKTEAIAHFMRLGEVYRGDGLYVRAVALYKKVLKLAPMHIEASSACAELYAEQGLIAEAKLQFQGLADHYLNRGDLSRTMEIYEKIIRMDPGHRPTLSKVVKVLVRPGQVGEALSELNALGMRLVEAGQIGDARQIYQGAVEFLRSQGRAAEAKSFTDALNSLPPDEAEALAAAFPGDGDNAEPVGIVTEETAPLEIFPGFSVEQEEVPALELES
ncbi:MAG: tetratricopeptide repeat protein, partial [candidate division NC10 bacterium]